MNSAADARKDPFASSAVAVTLTIVLHTRNGMRRSARSVIAPSTCESTKMSTYEMDGIRLQIRSARDEPKDTTMNCGNVTEMTPIEKIVLARSYTTHDTTALRRMTREGPADTGGRLLQQAVPRPTGSHVRVSASPRRRRRTRRRPAAAPLFPRARPCRSHGRRGEDTWCSAG